MTALSDVRRALKQTLDDAAIEGLATVLEWPNVIYVPSAGCACVINLAGIDYGETFGADFSRLAVELHMFVSLAPGFNHAQELLDQYVANTGARSILQAIRSDLYLGGTVAYCLPPTRIREYGVKQIGEKGEVELLGAIIEVEVYTR